MKFIVPHCCALVAVITVVVIGAFLVNVDAQNAENAKNTKNAKNDKKVGHVSLNGDCKLADCQHTAFHKCDFGGCQQIYFLDLRGKQLTGTLPEALQSLTNLQKLCVETSLCILYNGSVKYRHRLTYTSPLHL